MRFVSVKKRNRRQYVIRRARELAETGKYARWNAIEFELRFVEGIEEARGWLADRPIRDELDGICTRTHKKRDQDATAH
jgi:hypothetical protein